MTPRLGGPLSLSVCRVVIRWADCFELSYETYLALALGMNVRTQGWP